MANVQAILDRLDRVKARPGGHSWLARCPAHQDRSPSLSIKETTDGSILMHCFGGCPTSDVLTAIGLELADLFPEREQANVPAARRQRWLPREALESVAREALVLVIAADTLAAGDALTADDRARVAQAAGRIRDAAREAGCNV